MPETPALAAAAAPAARSAHPRAALLLALLLAAPLAGCDAIYDDTKGWANRLEAAILEEAHDVGEPEAEPAPQAAPAATTPGEMPAPPAVPVEPVAVAALPAPEVTPTARATAAQTAEPEGAMADASAALLEATAETPAEPAPAEAPAAAALPPAPKPKPAQPAAAKTEDEAEANDEALVAAVLHLSSLRSEDAAKREWSDLQRSFPEPLGQLQAEFHRTELGDKGTFYRVLAGPLPSTGAAAEVCAAVKAKDARQYCRVVPSKPKA